MVTPSLKKFLDRTMLPVVMPSIPIKIIWVYCAPIYRLGSSRFKVVCSKPIDMGSKDVKEKLYKAASDEDVDSLQRILDSCPNILIDIASSSSPMSKTPLHAAVEGRHVNCCRIILDNHSGFDC